ncbi:MAG: hypothetical protein MI747_11730 [Desulfobacterales bacterium]|nr:hypothetical protein [Desulfobacterales bacterium]
MMTGRGYLSLSACCLIFFLVTGAATALAQDSLKPFELAGLYQNELRQKPTGWYPLEGYLVFIADLERKDRSKSIRDMRGKAMIKVGELSRSWSVSQCGRVEVDFGNWPGRTKGIFQDYLEKKVQTPALAQFHAHVLENAPKGQRFRYAVAVPEKELREFCSGMKQVMADPSIMFARLLDVALEKENYRLASVLLWDAGLPHLASRAVQESLKGKVCMVNFTLSPTPLDQRRALRLLLNGGLEKNAAGLEQLPGSPEILGEMAKQVGADRPEKRFALLALSLAAAGDKRSGILKEMAGLCSAGIPLAIDTTAMDSTPAMMGLSAASLGNLRFGDLVPAYDDGYLKQAMALFSKGGDKLQIRILLEQSAEKIPANPKVWDYLGAMLKTEKLWPRAAAVYLQLLQLRPFDSEALAHLAQCYDRIGQKNAARRIADFIYHTGRMNNNKTIKRIIQEVRSDHEN